MSVPVMVMVTVTIELVTNWLQLSCTRRDTGLTTLLRHTLAGLGGQILGRHVCLHCSTVRQGPGRGWLVLIWSHGETW